MRHKPKGFYDVRLHVFILTLVDIGCRSSEALDWADVDFNNLLLKLHGKGAKDRLVPFSVVGLGLPALLRNVTCHYSSLQFDRLRNE
jgi:site-specific recombinase XerD